MAASKLAKICFTVCVAAPAAAFGETMNLGSGAFYAPDDLLRQGNITTASELRSADPFNEALRQGYLALAEQEVSVEYDWRDAGTFSRKAIEAGQGRPPAPSVADDWSMSAEDAATFGAMRQKLMDALQAGARERAPEAAARAQVALDCWAEEAEDTYSPAEREACEAAFLAALEGTRPVAAAAPAPAQPMPEPPARDYLVFSDWNQAEVRPDSMQILAQAMRAWRELGGQGIDLTGHADRSGAAGYNQTLSERRAEAVRLYFVSQGVPAEAITMSGRGETDPRVPTPDGVREQENRRVEIHIR